MKLPLFCGIIAAFCLHGNAQSTIPVTGVSTSSNPTLASRATDGSLSTAWSNTATDKAPQMFLGFNQASVSGIQIKVNPNLGTYSVETTPDWKNYTTVVSGKKNSTWNLETLTWSASPAVGIRMRFALASGQKAMVFEARPTGTTTQPTPTPTPPPGPTPTPTPVPNPSPTPPSGTSIVIYPGQVLHAANSLVLGTNRNHVTSDFPNGQAKLLKMRELQPSWGQGRYLYRIGHGPTDGRLDYSYMTGFHFEQVWNKLGPYPYDDLREGLKEAVTMGAQQIHVVNFGTSNPDEAGRYVSYLNNPADPNRQSYPHDSGAVKMFELGNEIAWSQVRGHSQYAATDTAYATRAKQFAQKMRAASPVPIQIGAVASINSNWLGNGWSGGASTVKNILGIMGKDVDFLIFHGYPSWPLNSNSDANKLMAQNEWNKQYLASTIKPAIAAAGRPDIRIANTENFSNLYNDATRSRGILGALFNADSIVLALNENFLTSIQFCFEHKALADASFFLSNDPTNTTAIFKFQQMLAQHFGDQIVQSTGNQIPSVAVTGDDPRGNVTVPRLAFAASTKGKVVFVLVVNRWNNQDVTSAVSVGFAPTVVRQWQLLGDGSGWDSANATVKSSVVSSLGAVSFPKASVTILEITP